MPLDIAVGIFLSLGVAHDFHFHASILLVLFGIGGALFPDIDNVIPLLERTTYDHRSFLHWPVLYVPFCIVFWVLNPVYGKLFTLGVLWHLLHDTIGIGWGVAWLAPFSKRKFLFPEKGRRREYGFFMTWLPEQESAMATKWHDPHWLTTWYLRPNLLAFIEYTALFVSVLALVVYYGAL